MDTLQYRSEYKHEINQGEYVSLLPRLKAIMRPDPHAGPDGCYWVSSLYFDNADDKALREKLDGLNHREKYRIRAYNGDVSSLRLEKKSKHDGLCLKENAPITWEQYQKILVGDTQFLYNSGVPLLQDFYAKRVIHQLRPRTIVLYRREAFVYAPGNVRVTIDQDIRTGFGMHNLFDPALVSASAAQHKILEVKFDEFLPEIIRDIVQVSNRQSAAFSKYAACRMASF